MEGSAGDGGAACRPGPEEAPATAPTTACSLPAAEPASDGAEGGSSAAESGAGAAASWAGLTEAHAEALRREGYAVVDGFLSREHAASLREEALAFARSGGMPAHRFQFGAAQFVKPHIFEADLHDERMQQELPELAELLFDDSLADSLTTWLPELLLERGPRAKALKLQYNAGSGGCFPWHYDNSGRPSRRAVTCVVYLNPDWKEGDGGEICLNPFLGQEVVIPPLMGRAAVFRSDLILHRVRPARAERLCFSIWLDGDAVNGDADCNLTAKLLSAEPEAVERLRRSPVQRAISRAVYADEYEESLLDCMDGARGCEEMIREHKLHVQQQRGHKLLGPFVEALRQLKQRASAA